MKIDIKKESSIDLTYRVEMLGSMFDVPISDKLSVSLHGELDLSLRPWNIGLIVGPSGSGKTLLLTELFGKPLTFNWNSRSVIDDFPEHLSIEEISRVCQSVGFNTIPAWLRPFSVLSNGEKFRAEVARHLLSDPLGSSSSCDINVFNEVTRIDEFTSVVDRQVAQFASHSVQKLVRESNRKLVVASCHYDIIDWLQPDWILEPGNPCKLIWRSLQRRPSITVSVSRVKYETWDLFKDFHYMSQDLNKAARCYGLFISKPPEQALDVRLSEHELQIQSSNSASLYKWLPYRTINNSEMDEQLVQPENSTDDTSSRGKMPILPQRRITSMCGVLYRPHPRVQDIVGITRMVTLPDFQGLGLAFVLANTVSAAYKALGKRLHNYPNHPAWIRSHQRSSLWMQTKNSGEYSPRAGSTSTVGGFGGRRCAVFEYIGPAGDVEESRRLINGN